MAKRILIIEDDADILEILEIIFQEEGFEIVSNRNGLLKDEVALLHPDLIMLDVRISGFEKTGAQLCAELKAFEQTRHLPIVLLSAERDLAHLAKESGADSFISKPFDIPTLIDKIKHLTK